MKGVNLVVLLGRLGSDPDVQKLANGTTVARFSVATSEVWKDKQGQKQEKTEWHRVVAWGKLGEICGEYLEKGSQVSIQGKLSTRSWEDQAGVKKYSTEIVAAQVQFIGGKSEGGGGGGGGGQRKNNSQRRDPAPQESGYDDYDSDGPEPDFTDDEIPF